MIKVMFICHGNMCRSYMIKKCTVYYNNGRVDMFPRTPTFISRYRAMSSVCGSAVKAKLLNLRIYAVYRHHSFPITTVLPTHFLYAETGKEL